MASFRIHLIGAHEPITLDLPCANIDDLADRAAHAKFLAGHMASPDEDGVCRRVMIATCRIQCVVET